MSLVIARSRRSTRLLALAGALLAGGALAPAAYAAGPGNPFNCTPSPQAGSQVFLPFGDSAYYTPVENAGLENGSAGWTLSGGASVVSDQEPWNVSGTAGGHALDLPRGSSAVTAPICIDPSYTYFRFFAREVNANTATDSHANNARLKVEVLYYNSKGRVRKQTPVDYAAQTAGWQATSQFSIHVFNDTSTTTAAPIALRFVAAGGHADFRVDDVYVDPWHRG